MRASPACQVSLQRFGAWRAAIVILAGAGLATLVGWAATRESPFSIAVLAPAMVATLVSGWVSASLWRISAQSLRWDGQAWHLDAVPGNVELAIDLGPWMLLRFSPSTGGPVQWLPLQRLGLEAQWHSLRCGVYSPRTVAEP